MIQGTGGFLNPLEAIKQLNILTNMWVADFGCGAGFFVIPMAEIVGKDGKVFALDVMDSALESVRSKAKMKGFFNIITKRCNLETLGGSQIENNSIDLVLLSNILFQSDNKAGIIKEGARILKPGGEMTIIDWRENQPMGPAKDLIIPIDNVGTMAEENGLKFKKEIQVDKYHWGMIFVK